MYNNVSLSLFLNKYLSTECLSCCCSFEQIGQGEKEGRNEYKSIEKYMYISYRPTEKFQTRK